MEVKASGFAINAGSRQKVDRFSTAIERQSSISINPRFRDSNYALFHVRECSQININRPNVNAESVKTVTQHLCTFSATQGFKVGIRIGIIDG